MEPTHGVAVPSRAAHLVTEASDQGVEDCGFTRAVLAHDEVDMRVKIDTWEKDCSCCSGSLVDPDALVGTQEHL